MYMPEPGGYSGGGEVPCVDSLGQGLNQTQEQFEWERVALGNSCWIL